MSAKNMFAILGVACASLAMVVFAQDDLDNLLNDLEGDKKPTAKAEAPAPAVAEAPAVSVPAEKPAENAEAPKPVAEPAPVAAEAPAPAAAEVPAPVADEKPAVAKQAENVAPAAEAPAAEAPTPAVPARKVAKETPAAPVAEKPAEPAQESLLAALIPASPEVAPAVSAAPVAEAVPPHPEAELISDLVATEMLRRKSLDAQASREMTAAREAMSARDWDEAYRLYRLAHKNLSDRADSAALRRECLTGMAESRYQAGKQALKDNDREAALALAKEAQKLRHPRAAALIDALETETVSEAVTDVSAISHRRNDKDYKDDRDTIRRRLRLASQYLSVLDLDKAVEQVDLVLRGDPYNAEAIALRARIQRRREIVIDNEREATRRGMIADIGAAWRPVYAVNSGELKSMDGGTMKTPVGGESGRSIEQSIEKRMKEMKLPSISFRPPATIIDAVDYFRQASKDFDRPDIPVDQRGFNFVLQLDKVLTSGGADAGAAQQSGGSNAFGAAAAEDEGANAGDVPVIPNVNASNVSLYEALQLVCKVCKPAYKFSVQGSVIMVMPKTMTTDEMVTRSYSVVEDFIDRMNNASSDLKNQSAGEFGGNNNGGDGEENPEDSWKAFFADLGVSWPQSSKIKYIKALGKLRVTNTEEQLAILEDALNELNVTPSMIEVETRFVEVAQEDLNSLGFEWLLNSDYSFNVGGKVAKALNLKNAAWTTTEGSPVLSDWSQTVNSSVQDVVLPVAGGTSSTTAQSTTRTTDTTATYTRSPDTYGWAKTGRRGHHGKNVGINAIDGTSYQSGMRYLSQEGNHISGEGASNNDQFMRVNAFLGNADLSMILHMLSQRSDTDLLSAPKVVTKSGQEATIKVVTIYRYPQDYDVTIQSTSSGSGNSVTGSSTGGSDGKILPMVEPQNFETQEVGVILTVTPELSAEGNLINLKLNPKVISEPTWKDYGMKVPMASVMSSTAQLASLTGSDEMQWFSVPMEQPFFKERSIDTVVTLYNGATVVMGGLITEERKSMEDKIPFLGDIPFLGRFFRSRSEWSSKRNLLLFVTARRVGPDGRMIQNSSSSDSDKSPAAPAQAAEEK